MNFKNVHHLREILVTDEYGKMGSTIQYSSQSISRFRPSFVDIPYHDQTVARELYVRLGGKLRQGLKIGIEVILDFTELDESSIQRA